MVEIVYKIGDTQGIQKVLLDENLHYIHMLFAQGKGLPEHLTGSNVYMTVLQGTLSIQLDAETERAYGAKTLLKIPQGTRMNVNNRHAETLELIVVKAPAPAAS
jgi:quercetin dioxygenase-like cupin family protein